MNSEVRDLVNKIQNLLPDAVITTDNPLDQENGTHRIEVFSYPVTCLVSYRQGKIRFANDMTQRKIDRLEIYPDEIESLNELLEKLKSQFTRTQTPGSHVMA